MSFFDEIGKKVTQVGNDTVKMTKDLSEIAKLNMAITSSEKKIQELYGQIGKSYFEKYSGNADSEFYDLISEINNQNGLIRENKEKICTIKGVTSCKNCGSEVSAESAFCPACGAKVERVVPENMTVCPGCGELVENDAKFCTKCGAVVKTEE